MLNQIKILAFVTVLFAMGWTPVYMMARAQLKAQIGPRFVASFFLIVIAGMFLPNALTYFLAIGVIFIATVRSRLEAICRYALLVGLAPIVFWQIGVGASYLFAVDTVSVLGLSAWAAAKIHGSRVRGRQKWTIEDTTVLIIFLILATADRAVTPTAIIRSCFTQGLMVALPYLVLRSNIRSGTELRPVIACIGVTAVILAFFALFEMRMTFSTLNGITQRLGSGGITWLATLRRGRFLRAAGPMSGPLMLGGYMVMAELALLASARYFKTRWAFHGFVAIGLLGLIAPQSRGSLLSFVVVTTISALLLRRWGTFWTLAIGGSLGTITLFALTRVSTSAASFLNVGTGREATGDVYDYRQLLLQRGMEEGMSHPLTGLSLARNLDHLADITQGQQIVDLVNVYLTFFLTSGLLGMVPLIACFLLTIVKGLRRPRTMDHDLMRLRFFAVSCFLTVLFEMSFMSFMDRLPYIIVMALFATRIYSLDAKQFSVAQRRDRALPKRAPVANVLPAPVPEMNAIA